MRKLNTYIKYAFDLFCKNIFIYLLLIFELVFGIMAINISLSSIQSLYTDVNLIKNANRNSIFFMPSSYIINASGGNSENYPDLSEIRGDYKIGISSKTTLYTDFANNGFIMYNQNLIDEFKIGLSKGDWNSQPIYENGNIYYPVIISNDDYIEYGEKISANTDKGQINCYVAGIIDEYQRFIKLSATSNIVSTAQLVDKCENIPTIFCNMSYFPSDSFNYIKHYSNKILFFEDISDVDIQYNLMELKNQGFAFMRDDIINNSIQEIKTNERYYIPLSLSVFLVSIIGLFSIIFLSVYKNKAFYKTILLCGGHRNDCVAIHFSILMIISSISIPMIYILNKGLCLIGTISAEEHKFTLINLSVTIAIYSFVLLSGYLISRLSLRKNNTNNIIKQQIYMEH